LGFAVPIAGAVSIYPIAELDVGAGSDDVLEYTGYGFGEQTENTVVVAARLLAPLLVHPVPHFFVGFGPSLYHEFTHRVTVANAPSAGSSELRETSVNLALLLGGWL
jgi:hypothetical protein